MSCPSMAPMLASAGIEYVAMPEFGGRRKPQPDSPNGAWRVAAFRAYADYMAEPEFALARERLMRMAGERRVAVMCAEAVWWRCQDRKRTRLNSSHKCESRMPDSA